MWIVRQAVSRIGARWVSAFELVLRNGREVDLRSIHRFEWAHIVREELRLEEWRRVGSRRQDMGGTSKTC